MNARIFRKLGALLLTLPVAMSFAETVAVYDFSGQSGTQEEQAPAEVAAGVTASALRRGPGLALPPEVPGTFSAAKWTLDPAQISGTDYFELSVEPTAGFAITLTSLTFPETVNAKGPAFFTVRSSLDNFESDLTEPFPLSPPSPANLREVALDDRFASLKEPVTFRFYAYGGRSSNGGVWGLGHAGEAGALRVNGSVLR